VLVRAISSGQFSFHQYLKNGRVIQVNPSLAAVP
jgi:hypothetical protein